MQYQASIVETVKAEYFDAPPPSDAFRFTLFKFVNGDWVSTGYTSDCAVESPHCEFEIVDSGKYRVTGRRVNIVDQQMGPAAESNAVYVGSCGEYEAPFRITLGVTQPDDDLPF